MMVAISNIRGPREVYDLSFKYLNVIMSTSDSNEVVNFNSNGEETNRSVRNKRKQMDPTCCPVCSLTIRNSEIDLHLASEIDKLYKVSTAKHKFLRSSATPSSHNGKENGRKDKFWDTYQKVRANRQNRQRVKSPRRKVQGVTCPVCNKETEEDISLHVDRCLRRADNSADSDENIDVEGYEEYEWAGQSRVRATSLLEGGVSTIGTSLNMADDDEDLVVDGDDSEEFGTPQYTERDVIVPDDEEQDALRKAVVGTDKEKKNSDREVLSENSVSVSGDPVLEALKNRIKELESRDYGKDEVYKCLICMERYRTPVISVCCWHVHCEQCWLQTLGTKKLCPQCNMITSPANLRRIYM
ncbi:E3 ubiquitin-protein ligase Rnf220-like [Agrilus planipennis]|uniref:E3 ubiquitin-protein ligase Rnf220-like n=1 Tax=Agrilus planipennis TaxID=224129 RepID=A0A1W4X5W4_AGRPL|nr:E3 ubiquitin-protein ligase Rnf220-like [Agrilus planipennis]